MKTITPRIFFRDTSNLGEGPVWFEDRLWWVDIEPGKLHAVDATGKNKITYDMGRRLGAAVPAGEGEFIVSLEDGIGLFQVATGTVEILASPEKGVQGNRFNDGKCDPVGRFVTGTLNMNGLQNAAALYSLDPKLGVKKIFSPVTCSNGLAWSADGTTMYYIDTLTWEIAVFPYDLQTGDLGSRRVVATIPKEMGLPDGMAIDSEGNLWVGHWDGGAVRCWSPVTGQCLAEIPMPCLRATSCCFGGLDFSSLFITTAQDDAGSELAGSVFVCEPGVSGYPVRRFAQS